MGHLGSTETFGQAGSGSACNAWADPACGVVFVYLTNRLAASGLGTRHQSPHGSARWAFLQIRDEVRGLHV